MNHMRSKLEHREKGKSSKIKINVDPGVSEHT